MEGNLGMFLGLGLHEKILIVVHSNLNPQLIRIIIVTIIVIVVNRNVKSLNVETSFVDIRGQQKIVIFTLKKGNRANTGRTKRNYTGVILITSVCGQHLVGIEKGQSGKKFLHGNCNSSVRLRSLHVTSMEMKNSKSPKSEWITRVGIRKG